VTEKILFVDDDELILAAWERSLGRQFRLDTASGPSQALEKIEARGPYAVVVSDMRMPEMDGLELLRRIRVSNPDTVRLILTGNADMRTAIDAVNDGAIFRFLEKPCPNEVLSKVLAAALDQHRLIHSEKDLLEKTLHGSVKVLTEVLSLVNPEAFSTAARIALYVKNVSTQLGLKDAWRFEMAAMLSHLGCVVLSTETLESVRLGRRLSKEEEARYASHPSVARDLLRNIPRLESIAAMVARQQEAYKDQHHQPLAERGTELLGAQILKVCIRFESLVRSGIGHVGAIESLRKSPAEYDPAIVAVLVQLPIESLPCEPHYIAVEHLLCRMVLDEDLRTKDGILLVAKGIEITETLLTRIENFYGRNYAGPLIRVLVPISLRKWLKSSQAAIPELLNRG